MAFFDIFKTKQREATPAQSCTPGVPSSTTEKPAVSGGRYEERIVYARSPQTALTVSAVYRAVELRSKTIGQMPVQWQEKGPGGNFTTKLTGLGKRMNYLLQEEPNPLMCGPELWEQVTINRLMWGNGFVYVERDDMGFPYRLWLVNNGNYNIMTGRYNIGYLSDEGYIERVDVPRDDVLHFANTFRYQNGFWGISTLQFAFETLSLIKTQKAQALETAAKGGRVKGFIGEEKSAGSQGTLAFGMFNRDTMADYAKEIQDKIYGGQDIIAIRGLDKFQNISMTSAEMQMIEQMSLSYDDLARFYGVPRPLLMLDTNSHYNDYSNATMEFMTRSVFPDKNAAEKEIQRKLIGLQFYGTRRIHICEKPLLAMDPERQAKVDRLNLETGASTINEVRAEHDRPAVENGDEPLASANLMTLNALIAKGEASTELKPGSYTVPAPAEGTEGTNQ